MKFLESKSVKELIALAKEWGLTGYSKLKRTELIALLIKHRAEVASAKPSADKVADKVNAKAVAPEPRRTEPAPRRTEPAPRRAEPAPLASTGTGRMGLLARDPHWLYCFWEPDQAIAERLQAGSRPALQVSCIIENHEELIDRIPLSPGARSWYLHVDWADMTYRCDLGLVDDADHFEHLLASNLSTTPPEGVSTEVEGEFGSAGESPDAHSRDAQQAHADRMYVLSAGAHVRGLDSAEAQWLRQRLEQKMPGEALHSASLPISPRGA